MKISTSNSNPTRKWQQYRNYLTKGDWHLHTTYTDGKSEPEEYFLQAEKNELEFIIFSEHVRKKMEYDYLKFKEKVYKIGSKSKVKFIVGVETKVINIQGEIDISNDVLKEAEMILFSFHSPYFDNKEDYITAIMNASSNPHLDIWAHPPYYHQRYGFEMLQEDWQNISQKLAEQQICYEINNKYGLPNMTEITTVCENNVPLVFGSDAHSKEALLNKNKILKLNNFIKIMSS